MSDDLSIERKIVTATTEFQLVSDQVKVTILPDGRVSRSDAAAFLGRQPKTLAMWALEGRGPRIIRVGGRCFYMINDLRRFGRGEME